GQLFALTHERCAGYVDIDVVLILGIDYKRMGVRAAASLHCCDLPGTLDVGYIENPYAAESIFLRCRQSRLFLFPGWRRRSRWKSLCAAIEAAIWLFDRHKHQVLVNRHIPLSTRTNHGRYQLGFSGIGDVIDIDAIKITQKQVASLERKVRVCKRQLSANQLHWLRYLGRICNAHHT